MYRVRQEELPFVGSSHEFVGSEQGDVGISVFLFSGLPGKGPGRIAIPTMRSSLSGKATEYGPSMGRLLKVALGTFSSSRLARFTASKPSGMPLWSKWTFI